MYRESATDEARRAFVEAMSRIAAFWGVPSSLGAVYAVVYLSREPVPLGDLVGLAGVSKGAASLHGRTLERLGLVRRVPRIGDRKDYYEAETDFWKVVRGILRERQNRDFDRALGSVSACLELLEDPKARGEESQWMRERLGALTSFFSALDHLVSAIVALDELSTTVVKRFTAQRRSKS